MKTGKFKLGLGNRGILYSFMALLLILSVLAFQDTAKNQQNKMQDNSIMNDAFVIVNNRFNNILLDVAIIGKEGPAKEIQERIVPFTYTLDGNDLAFNSELPLNEGLWERHFDSINAYRIFVSDNNYSNIYDGLLSDVNTLQNSDWEDGSANKLNFSILPQCLNYFARHLNIIGLEPGYCGESGESFDINSVERFDLNVGIRPGLGEDYNTVECNITGFAGICPNEAYDSSNPFPYFELWINDTSCTYCMISASLKNIKGHYNPLTNNTINIFCDPGGGSCTSDQISIELGEGVQLTHTGNVIDVIAKASFTSKVHYIYIPDFNVSVQNQTFEISKRTTN